MNKKINIILIIFVSLQLGCHPEKTEETNIVRPKLLSTQESLRYPVDAYEQGIQGKTVLRILVNKRGEVGEAKIIESSGSDVLDEAALRMANSSVFKPGSIDGVKTDFWLHLPVQFKLGGEHNLVKDIDYWTGLTFDYQKQIESGSKVNKSDTYKDLYYHYQSLALEVGGTRSTKANKGILSVVDNSIGKRWQEYQDIWPLGFLLFQDFIKRYPNNEFAAKSHDDLIKYLRGEIEILQQKSISSPPYSTIFTLLSESLKKLHDQDL